MRLIYIISLLGFLLLCTSSIQLNKSELAIWYDKKGNQVTYNEIIQIAKEFDVVLFGELHDDSICHSFERKFCSDIRVAKNGHISIGLEMFEADDQIKIDEYLSGKISQKSFETEARFWPNYEMDYKPILEEAKENGIKIIASNVPRRYASMVYMKGVKSLDELSKKAKSYVVPLPLKVDFELPTYEEMTTMGSGHNPKNLIYAQALKDATMAHFILKNIRKNQTLVHLNGNYHSKDYEGIYWYLKQKKSLNVLTLATVKQDDIEVLEKEHVNEADYILCIKNL